MTDIWEKAAFHVEMVFGVALTSRFGSVVGTRLTSQLAIRTPSSAILYCNPTSPESSLCHLSMFRRFDFFYFHVSLY